MIKYATPEPPVTESLNAIKESMRRAGAQYYIDNLRGPATEEQIAGAEARVGGFPISLRSLYLAHAGNDDWYAGFLPEHCLANIEQAEHDRDEFLSECVSNQHGILSYSDGDWLSPRLYPEELNTRWWILGDSEDQRDYLLTHLDSERVFWFSENYPPLEVAASNIGSFFRGYLRHLESGRCVLPKNGNLRCGTKLVGEWDVALTMPDDTSGAQTLLDDLLAHNDCELAHPPTDALLLRLQAILNSGSNIRSQTRASEIAQCLEDADEIEELYANDYELSKRLDEDA